MTPGNAGDRTARDHRRDLWTRKTELAYSRANGVTHTRKPRIPVLGVRGFFIAREVG